MPLFLYSEENPVILKSKLSLVALISTATLLTSCASIVNGQNQPVSVSTTPKNATCALENNKGKWYINNTPGSVTVNRSYHDLQVTCEKKGYKKAEKKVASATKAMAFGNVVFGGVIGAGVDMADGAAYDYPTEIQVPLDKA